MRSKSLRKGLVFLLAVTMLFSLTGAQAMPNEATDDSDKVEILIGFESAPNPATYSLIRAQGWEITGELPQINVLVVTLPVLPDLPDGAPEAPLERAREALVDPESTEVSFIEENGLMYAHGQKVPWGVDRIGAVEAHDISTGTAVGIAILDTGIDPTHDDLKVKDGYAVVTCRGGGCTEPWDDDHWHGTHVAGTAAALDNELGVLGVAPAAELYAVKVLANNGRGTWADVAEGINWAADQGIEVLNMSLGGGHSDTVKEAVKYAYGEGSLLVASAGNSGPGEDTVRYPAAYKEVIAVSATDEEDKIATFSSRGDEVELAAPGVDIQSTVPGDDYEKKSGTSMAAPHVAGVAALVWAADSTLSNADVRGMLQESAEDIGLDSTEQGYGLVNAAAAVGVEVETGSLEGTVIDTGGEPLEHAIVEIEETGDTAETDSEGYYIINEVSTGEYDVTASKDGYKSETHHNVTISTDKTTEQDFTLEEIETYTVSGTVSDTEKDPIKGATVKIEETGDTVETNEEGDYEFEEVEEGTYDFTASAEGYRDSTKEKVEVNKDITDINFSLEEIENTPPEVIIFKVEDTSNPRWARVEIEWEVYDEEGLLDVVILKVLDGDGNLTKGKTIDVSGTEASGVDELRESDAHDEFYKAKIEVYDEEEEKDTDSKIIGN